jgi:hypothetical protein
MYCLQWFLPLLLLARPVSPPLFLLTYLASLILHHRPCLVCTGTLLGVYAAGCYANGACWVDVTQPPWELQLAHWETVGPSPAPPR